MKTVIHDLDDGSGVVILPREILDSLNLQVGDEFQIIDTDSGIILRPVPCDDLERQMRVARDVMDQYESALQKLAKQIETTGVSRPRA
jgi:putative addiction module antidote